MTKYLLAVLLISACGFAPINAAEPNEGAVAGKLEEIRKRHDLPAMAGGIVTLEGPRIVAVVGVRRKGSETPATKDDTWHLGSNTKAMVGTLVGILAEKGGMKWETTVAEVFPELREDLHPAVRDVTLKQLLAHRSGLKANVGLGTYSGPDGPALRQKAIRQELAKQPPKKVGEFLYSNLGYMVAGAMLERQTGKAWEDLMQEMIFTPLNMTDVGFGGMGTAGKVDQPWPHNALGQPMPQNGPLVDNPPVMGPAGTVHCTLGDWGRYVADLLRGLSGTSPSLMDAETYANLVTPIGDYALGWGVTQRPWGAGTVLNHNGSNTMNFATVWVAPKKGFAVLVCTNQGGDKAAKACDEAAGALIQHHLEAAQSK